MAGVLEELMVKIGANTKSAEKRIDGFSDFVENATDKVSGFGAVGGAGFVAAFAEAAGQESESDLLAAQLDLTTAESARAGEAAGDLFANAYGESFGEVNDAIQGIIAQMGDLGDVSDAELTGLGANALDLARILETDVSRVIQVAGQAVSEGLAADMEEAFDLITTASQQTMPGLTEEVLDAADEYAQFFRTLGFDGERAFGLLAAASAGGQYEIDKTGDAIKEFTIRATDMSEASQDAFETIGLDAQTMANQILAGGDTAATAFDDIVTGLLGIEDPTERANAAIALFGTPIEDLSVQDIPDFLAGLIDTESALGDVAGATDDAGATLNDNAQTGFMTLARTAREDLVASLAPLLPMLQDLAGFLIPLAPLLLGIAAALTIVAIGIGAYKVALVIATVSQWLFNAALWANPITWIILAIVALIAIIVLLIVYWDEVSAAVVAAWDAIWNAIKTAASAVLDFILEWWPYLLAIFTGGLSILVGLVIDNWDSIVGFISGAVDKIGGFLSGMWDGITEGLKSALNWAIGKINEAIGGINVLIDGANRLPGVSIPHIPSIPYLAEGGTILGSGAAMVGEAGPEIVDLPRGARVSPLDRTGGGRQEIVIRLDGDEDLIRLFRRGIQARGGDVQLVLGS